MIGYAIPMLGVTAILPLILLVVKALREGSLEVRLLVISYLAGQVLCWVVGLLGCVYLPIQEVDANFFTKRFFNCPYSTQLGPIGFFPFPTMLLINLVTWGGAIACILAYPFRSSKNDKEFEKLPIKSVRTGIWIGGGVFLIFILVGYLGNAHESRNIIGNALIPGSLLYFLSALGRLQYILFFFLGASLRQPLWSWYNLVIGLVVLGCITGLGIMIGGKEVGVYVSCLFLGGSLYSSLNIKQTTGIVIGLLPFLLYFFVAMNIARGAGVGYMDLPMRVHYFLTLIPGVNWFDKYWSGKYQITELTLSQLKEGGVPESVIKKLEPLLNQGLRSDTWLDQQLTQRLGEKKEKFEASIRNHSTQVYPWENKNLIDHIYHFLTRLAEPSGQLVIDRVTENQRFIGFQNFERLLKIFLPKFIFGEKPSANDGPERLQNTYGWPINRFSSAPITLLAGTFERGGYWATFIASFILAFWLTLLGRGLKKIPNGTFRALLLIFFAYICFRLFSFSLMGAVRQVTYVFLRDAILLGLLWGGIKWLAGKYPGKKAMR